MKKHNGNSATRCSFCKKNAATIHYTEVINNKMQKIHLCEECAKQKGIDIELPFSFSDVLAALSGGVQALAGTEAGAPRQPVCGRCGLTMAELAKHGRLGCAQCYDTFADTLRDIVTSVHKSPNHTGKMPAQHLKTAGTRKRIAEIEASLQLAIAEERYEDCAPLRDEIKRLKAAQEAKANA